jgi:membrane protein YqaA with SNARE-associated domain
LALATIEATTIRFASGSVDKLKEHAAFRWLGDEAEEQRLQQEKTYNYGRWTLLVAVAAVIASLIAVGLAQLR